MVVVKEWDKWERLREVTKDQLHFIMGPALQKHTLLMGLFQWQGYSSELGWPDTDSNIQMYQSILLSSQEIGIQYLLQCTTSISFFLNTALFGSGLL